jgi:RNA-directed DNA polymerase
MLQRLQDRGFPKRLLQQQEGKCPVCGQLIDDEAQWLIRPIVPIKAGGTRSLANLKLLHSYCQRQFRIATGKFSARDTEVPAP